MNLGKIDPVFSKSRLRKKFRQQIAVYSKEYIEECGQRIQSQLISAIEVGGFKHVALYAAMGKEIDILPVARELVGRVDFYLPVMQSRGVMDLHIYSWGDVLVPNRWGILEPTDPSPDKYLSHRVRAQSVDSRSVLICVPCLALDIHGNRLGQGGGYYDRYLANHSEFKTVGIVYPDHVVDRLPVDMWDRRVGGIENR